MPELEPQTSNDSAACSVTEIAAAPQTALTSATANNATSDFRPCITIPVFNHGDAIETMVESLLPQQLPIILVDDGSGSKCQRKLQQLQQRYPQLQLERLPQNSGKGAAVMRAWQLASQRGFSHAVQIDADCQHRADELPSLLAAAAAEPNALVLGQPRFDASIPAIRRYGKLFSPLWIWICSLSFSVRDGLCGYRVYPLAQSISVAKRANISTRMPFDIDVLIHLLWDGLLVRNVPVQVTYPLDGVSHFRLLRDNLRIIQMQTWRCVQAPLYWPSMLLQRLTRQHTQWQLRRNGEQ